MSEVAVEQSETALASEVEAEVVAVVNGETVSAVPLDLYIPPQALKVILDMFTGPLDLLLYLIRRQNLDILNIPIALITKQYVAYIDMMKDIGLELAAEYLVMAATLAEIKSRLMLPKLEVEAEEEGLDPREALIRRLQNYERFKQAAEDLDSLPRMGRDVFVGQSAMPAQPDAAPERPDVDLRELLFALQDVMKRVDLNASHQIARESISVRARMSAVLERLSGEEFVVFTGLFPQDEGRQGVVVTFIAILELAKEALIRIVQNTPFGPIHVQSAVCDE